MTEPAVVHGGRIEAAVRRYPDAPRPFIDCSTGINPVPYPIAPLADHRFTRLPEPEALHRLLIAAAAAYGAVDPACLAAAPGTQILISLLPHLHPPTRVGVLSPTYSEHADCWARAGHTVQPVNALPDLAACQVAILCNPNNPDGSRHGRADLLALADRLRESEGLLIVDEAFADLEPEVESLIPCLPHPAIVVLRSFGKSYGLAGLRLGFAAAAPDRAAAITAALGPWAVSGPAIAIGRAALADISWREAAIARLSRDAARLDGLLADAGLAPCGGTRLFRLCRSPSAEHCADRLAQAGILVRQFPDQPDRLRFGIPGDPLAWARLGDALGSLS